MTAFTNRVFGCTLSKPSMRTTTQILLINREHYRMVLFTPLIRRLSIVFATIWSISMRNKKYYITKDLTQT